MLSSAGNLFQCMSIKIVSTFHTKCKKNWSSPKNISFTSWPMATDKSIWLIYAATVYKKNVAAHPVAMTTLSLSPF